jgi:hypothetical protein
MLSRWKPLFAYLPVESVIRDNQEAYYAALNQANRDVHSGTFVEFMLRVILETLQAAEEAEPPVTPPVTPPVKILLQALKTYGALSNSALLEKLKLKDRRRMRELYIRPAMEAGLVEYTIPDKPTSRNQRYRLSEAGLRRL